MLTIAPPPRFAHRRDHVLDAEPRADDVDAKGQFENRQLLVFDRTRAAINGGVVDEAVDTAELGDGGADDVIPRGLFGDIVGDESSGVAEGAGNLATELLLHVGGDHSRTCRHTPFGVAPAHALGGTGDDDHLAVEFPHCVTPVSDRTYAYY